MNQTKRVRDRLYYHDTHQSGICRWNNDGNVYGVPTRYQVNTLNAFHVLSHLIPLTHGSTNIVLILQMKN